MRRNSSGSTGHAVGQIAVEESAGPPLPGIFSRYKDTVEWALHQSVPHFDGDGLLLTLHYHLGWVDRKGNPAATPLSQGKALRPTLCLFACEALEADPVVALPAAAALELIHNFSLVHDDIQDQDIERRHQPTLWRQWGVPRALAAGSGLQAVGDMTLLNVAGPSVPAETALRVSLILSECSLEMMLGQCLDLQFESQTDILADAYLQMIAYKTGALIRSGLEIGALLASNDPDTFRAFSSFGDAVGRAFQIRDDYLGIWGDQAMTGKAAGNDIRRRKKTFPVVYALEKAAGKARRDLMRIYGYAESPDDMEDDDVGRVLDILEEVGAREESQMITQASAMQALDSIAGIGLPPWARTEAESLVDFLANREF